MTADLSFVAGLILAGLAALSVLARYAEGRRPRAGFFWLAAGIALIGYAEAKSPTGYSLAGIPAAVVRVVGDFVN